MPLDHCLSPRAVRLDFSLFFLIFFYVQEAGFYFGMLSKLVSEGFRTTWALGAWRGSIVPPRHSHHLSSILEVLH